MHSFPIINVTHQNGTFFPPKDDTTLTHHNHPKPIVSLKVYPCFCTFYGSGQMHITHIYLSSSHSSAGKESACNTEDPSSILGSGSSAGEGIDYPLQYSWASLVVQLVKNPPAMQETWVQSLS